MAMIFNGDIIRQRRMEQNYTLEQVCGGIINAATLSRIERGERTPTIFVLKAIFERLGIDAEKYYLSVQTKMEIEIQCGINDIESMLINKALEKAQMRLDILVRNIAKSIYAEDKLVNQTLLQQQIDIFLRMKEKEKAHSLIIKAINITIENFSESNIENLLLTYNEISLLNALATLYAQDGDEKRGINIQCGIIKSMDKHYADEYEKSRGYIMTLFNLSTKYLRCKEYDLALNTCNVAIEHCKKNQRYTFLPKIVFHKACALYYMGNQKEYPSLMVQAYSAMCLFGHEQDALHVNKYIVDNNIPHVSLR